MKTVSGKGKVSSMIDPEKVTRAVQGILADAGKLKEQVDGFLEEQKDVLGEALRTAKSAYENSRVIRAGVVGATGYAGAELTRLLLGHPNVEIAGLSSVTFAGKRMSEIYPALYGLCDMTLTGEDEVIEKSDVVFASLPHGLSEKLAEKCLAHGAALIDLGADFRLKDEETYRQWYGLSYQNPALHEKSAYCIPELHRERIRDGKVKIVANPGCYVTCATLALAPLLKAGAVRPDSIIIDAKSGVTGAGRGLTQTTHFPDCNESFAPYKVAAHRHTPEIEQNLSELAGKALRVSFTPHLLPLNRGIIATCYASLSGETEDLCGIYQDFYRQERFVRVLPQGRTANLKYTAYSNYCDISVHPDLRSGRVIVVSALDNMGKGAAGQAVQNMNLLFGLPEESGLLSAPPAV